MLRPIFFMTFLVLGTSGPSAKATYLVSSKEEALNKLKAKSQTYNMSYPGGETTTTPPSTTTQMTCPPVTCPPADCPAATCPPAVNNNLVYILTPILSVAGFGLGTLVGALCMKRHGMNP